ncbi:MAG: hypothetical protein EZS28_043326, partial [Streblomastix strix]
MDGSIPHTDLGFNQYGFAPIPLQDGSGAYNGGTMMKGTGMYTFPNQIGIMNENIPPSIKQRKNKKQQQKAKFKNDQIAQNDLQLNSSEQQDLSSLPIEEQLAKQDLFKTEICQPFM